LSSRGEEPRARMWVVAIGKGGGVESSANPRYPRILRPSRGSGATGGSLAVWLLVLASLVEWVCPPFVSAWTLLAAETLSATPPGFVTETAFIFAPAQRGSVGLVYRRSLLPLVDCPHSLSCPRDLWGTRGMHPSVLECSTADSSSSDTSPQSNCRPRHPSTSCSQPAPPWAAPDAACSPQQARTSPVSPPRPLSPSSLAAPPPSPASALPDLPCCC